MTDLKNIADNLLAKKSDLFATYDSIEELIRDNDLKGVEAAWIISAMNTTLQMVANDLYKKADKE